MSSSQVPLLVLQGSLVFVVGKMDGLLTVSGRRHNADDIVATGLAVESIKTVYRGRSAQETPHKLLHVINWNRSFSSFLDFSLGSSVKVNIFLI